MSKKRYNKIDKDKAKRFIEVFQKLNRCVSPYRKRRECQKEIFIRRTLNKWFSGKYFEVILEEGTGFFKEDYSEILVPVKRYVYISNISFALTSDLPEKVRIECWFGHEFRCPTLYFPFNKFLNLEFKEIDQNKYRKIQELFVDDRT